MKLLLLICYSLDVCFTCFYVCGHIFQGVGSNDEKVLAATNAPYALDAVCHMWFYVWSLLLSISLLEYFFNWLVYRLLGENLTYTVPIYIPLPEGKARQHIFMVKGLICKVLLPRTTFYSSDLLLIVMCCTQLGAFGRYPMIWLKLTLKV